jgi:hypothetical protein
MLLRAIESPERAYTLLTGILIEDIVNNGEHLLVNLTCIDARGELYATKFDIDFRGIGSENRNIPYQYDYNSVPIKTMTNRDYSTITPEILISV